MENKYRLWLFIFASGFIISFSVLLFLIFSPYMTRYNLSLKLRDTYVTTLFNIRKVFGQNEADFCWYFQSPISPLRKNVDGTYNYAIVGKIVEIDEEIGTITLECSNNKRYKLFTAISKTNEPGWLKIDVGVNTKAERPKENPIMFFKPGINLSAEKDPYFKKDQLYMAIWKDNRELTEINESIKNKDGAAVNMFDNLILSLLRY